MEQYIKKSALVAEIERRKELVSDPILLGNDLMIGERNAYFNLLSFIDSLEVKDVNLEKEIDVWYQKPPKEFENIEECAKHFFELGIKAAQKRK